MKSWLLQDFNSDLALLRAFLAAFAIAVDSLET
jgi:hypothetical protein